MTPKRAWIDPAGLRAVHDRLRLGGRAVLKRVTSSTNDDAKALADAGAPEGTLVLALHQTGGKGRLGRRWQDCAGEDILFSLVLRPRPAMGASGLLTVLASVSVVDAVRRLYRRTCRIKWPNDVVYRGGKLAGVLVETGKDRLGERYAVLGTGINAGAEASDEQGVSLRQIMGSQLDRRAVLEAVIAGILSHCRAVQAGDMAALEARWQKASATLGKTVTILSGRTCFAGRVTALSLSGGITLRRADGATRTFRGEHVTVLRHPSRLTAPSRKVGS